MIGKVVAILLSVIVLGFSLGYLYQAMPQPPVNLEVQEMPSSEPAEIMNYGATPVFSENLRFNHNNISYSIDMKTCSAKEAESMKQAFTIFHEEMGIISFSQVYSDDADIKISCPDKRIEIGESLFAAGEGGPSEIINTSLFRTIREGKIYLYESPRCDYPVVELHELGHVFGFDHSTNKKNIMYNTSDCEQRISEDMVALIKQLYSINPLPELRISELEAVKKGKYIDFNITVLNEGLQGVNNVSLTLVSEGEEVEKVYLGEIGIGYGRTIKATNVRISSSSSEEVMFVVDIENKVKEYSKENNQLTMTVQSQ